VEEGIEFARKVFDGMMKSDSVSKNAPFKRDGESAMFIQLDCCFVERSCGRVVWQ